MIKFRTISHILKIYVLPEVKKRIENGKIKRNDLPLEVNQFRLIQRELPNGNMLSTIEINKEVNLRIKVKVKRSLSAGESLTLKDIYPEKCFICPPDYNGKPMAYFLCQSLFCDYFLFFDFEPNLTNITKEELKEIEIPYPILVFINNKNFNKTVCPLEKIKILSDKNWPPAPGYYPRVLLELHKDLTIIDSPNFLEIVSSAYGTSYWDKRITFWQETNFFPNRIPYLKHALDAHFNKDYITSIYVLVPQFEGIIRDYLLQCGRTPAERYQEIIQDFKKLVLSRNILMFPQKLFETIFDYLENGSFWKRTDSVSDPATTINRHGIAHGIFTGFECKEISLKYLILLDSLSFVLLHDKMMMNNI
jgi:hypothetical protein